MRILDSSTSPVSNEARSPRASSPSRESIDEHRRFFSPPPPTSRSCQNCSSYGHANLPDPKPPYRQHVLLRSLRQQKPASPDAPLASNLTARHRVFAPRIHGELCPIASPPKPSNPSSPAVCQRPLRRYIQGPARPPAATAAARCHSGDSRLLRALLAALTYGRVARRQGAM